MGESGVHLVGRSVEQAGWRVRARDDASVEEEDFERDGANAPSQGVQEPSNSDRSETTRHWIGRSVRLALGEQDGQGCQPKEQHDKVSKAPT